MARVPNCPFCDIAKGQTEGRTPGILYQDERVLAFEDRSPAASKHYLVIPLAHIKNVNALTKSKDDCALVMHMQKIGQLLLDKDAPDAKHRLGFHRPPFNSVGHLHLHCLALPYRVWWRSVPFSSLGIVGSWISAERVLQRLVPGGASLHS